MKIREKIKIDTAARGTGSRIIKGDPSGFIESISTDTRTLSRGDFFIPLKGENFDGHDFIEDAARAGAGGFVYERHCRGKIQEIQNKYSGGGSFAELIIETEDVLDFYQKLARDHMMRFDPVVIAITGSVGKTTTRDLIVSILSQDFNVIYTPRNHNTEIGIAGAMMNIGKDTDF
ncbi:MAG: Mur ligase domain-containing protein, partial [Actinobacteria bacterium]|nr:Mur ligase domain-containing protein [Actinomycetota bacterium]